MLDKWLVYPFLVYWICAIIVYDDELTPVLHS